MEIIENKYEDHVFPTKHTCEHCDLGNNECDILSSCPLEIFYVFKKSNKQFEP